MNRQKCAEQIVAKICCYLSVHNDLVLMPNNQKSALEKIVVDELDGYAMVDRKMTPTQELAADTADRIRDLLADAFEEALRNRDDEIADLRGKLEQAAAQIKKLTVAAKP
jgi:hypothetical protein